MTAQFGYLLNAMERAACESNPAEHDYKGKRIAVLGYVSALEVELERLRDELAALQQMYTAQGLTIKRQQDELAEYKRDAERYRAVRYANVHNIDPDYQGVMNDEIPVFEQMEDLDKVVDGLKVKVDAALAAKGE